MAIARMGTIDDDLDIAFRQPARGEGFRALGKVGFVRATAVDFGGVDVLQANGFGAAFNRIAVDGDASERSGGEM